MLLAVDIGNSNITLGIFDGNDLKDVLRMVSDKKISKKDYTFLLEKLTAGYEIKDCVIASVVDELTPLIYETCSEFFNLNPFLVNAESKLPILVNVDNPEQVGADRLVNSSAAVFYGKPVIVVDFGTATTIDVINVKGEFIGGVIMPGVKMQAKSLREKTSKLPEADVYESVNAIGANTIECINSGILRGTACAVDGLINQIEFELGEKALIVATGGLCETVAKYMNRKFDRVDKTLTLTGLKCIYEMNASLRV